VPISDVLGSKIFNKIYGKGVFLKPLSTVDTNAALNYEFLALIAATRWLRLKIEEHKLMQICNQRIWKLHLLTTF
jgi:hypothetical protein